MKTACGGHRKSGDSIRLVMLSGRDTEIGVFTALYHPPESPRPWRAPTTNSWTLLDGWDGARTLLGIGG